MKRTFITLVSTAVLLMAATACYDAIECPDVLRTNDKIKFVPEDNLLTKAPVTTFPTDFGITLSASHSSAGSYMVGIPFSRNSSNEWEPSTAKYWPQSGTLSFLGFAKKNLSVSNVSWNADPSYQVSMTVGDNSSLQEDLMFTAAASVGKQTTAYPLTFRHAMANLQFTVAAPDGAYNSSNNTGITVSSIKLVNVYNSGNVTATRSGASVSYAWSSLGNQKNLTAPGISNASVATTATALGNGLVVVPQICVGVQIEYVLHNGKDGAGTAVNTTRTYTYTPSGSWAAGSKYTIAFSISQGQVSATTSISAWTNATQNWIFGTGNTVSWVGNDFSFTSGNLNNIWWRLDGSSSYEPLTYVEGTWGSSVKLESSEYYVTLTATGSLYTVSYEGKRTLTGIRVAIVPAAGLTIGSNANAAVVNMDQVAQYSYSYPKKYNGGWTQSSMSRMGANINANIYATYSDGNEELVTNLSSDNTLISISFPSRAIYLEEQWPYAYPRNTNEGSISNASTINFHIQKGDFTQYLSQGQNYFDATAAIEYTLGSVTKTANCSFTVYGSFYDVGGGNLVASYAGQTLSPYAQGRSTLELSPSQIECYATGSGTSYNQDYYYSNLSPFVSNASVSANNLIDASGSTTFVVKSNADFTSSTTVTGYIANYDGSQIGFSNIVNGYDKTVSVSLLTTSYWGLYGINEATSDEALLKEATDNYTWDVYYSDLEELSDEWHSINYFVFVNKADGRYINVTGQNYTFNYSENFSFAHDFDDGYHAAVGYWSNRTTTSNDYGVVFEFAEYDIITYGPDDWWRYYDYQNIESMWFTVTYQGVTSNRLTINFNWDGPEW